ncbi:MAG: histidine triad nucleotide-binding protein [Acidimicrobiaceae bacterium]|nr:histidine triad nucleotide-binding protein [Acidimicrobiaceae bacterium]
MTECLFCRIVSGDIPSSKVAESDRAYAFYDISPAAPVHVLVVPKVHVESADTVSESDEGVVDELVRLAQHVADLEGVRESGYRLVLNVGADAQNSVPHLHLHVLGGRRLEWPAG